MPAIFTIIFFVGIFFCHWIIYRFFIALFKVSGRKKIFALRIVFAFLPFSFLTSFFLTHFFDNFITRTAYLLSGLWYGFFINLIMCIGAGEIIFFLIRLKRSDFSRLCSAGAALVLSLVILILSVVNVFFPRVSEVKVKISGLPDEWQGKTIVQLSDLHFGKTLGPVFAKMITQKANSLSPDLIAITGDLFDGTDGSLEKFISPLSSLHAKHGVFYVSGNHEVYVGANDVFVLIEKTGIIALRDEIVEIDGLQLVGISYPEPGNLNPPERRISQNPLFDRTKPSILLFHSPSGISRDSSHQRLEAYFYPNIDFSAAMELGIDLQLSGHTHNGQIFPVNLLTHYIYKGFDYGLHRIGDFQIYTASGAGVWGPLMRTSGRSEIVKIILERE